MDPKHHTIPPKLSLQSYHQIPQCLTQIVIQFSTISPNLIRTNMASINDDFTLLHKNICKTTTARGLGLEHDTRTTTKGGSGTRARSVGVAKMRGGASAQVSNGGRGVAQVMSGVGEATQTRSRAELGQRQGTERGARPILQNLVTRRRRGQLTPNQPTNGDKGIRPPSHDFDLDMQLEHVPSNFQHRMTNVPPP